LWYSLNIDIAPFGACAMTGAVCKTENLKLHGRTMQIQGLGRHRICTTTTQQQRCNTIATVTAIGQQ
jgi:hypothetical protein